MIIMIGIYWAAGAQSLGEHPRRRLEGDGLSIVRMRARRKGRVRNLRLTYALLTMLDN